MKGMKIWQQVLAQQMKPLISPILNDFDSSEAPTFLGCFNLPLPLVVGRLQTIKCAAVRVRASRLESHQRCFWIETLIMPRRLII